MSVPPVSHRLSAAGLVVEVRPGDGGRIASITCGGTELLVPAPPVGEAHDPLVWGSYPMVPWAGRIRGGRFRHAGSEYQLPVGVDGHAMHGVGYLLPWDVEESTARLVVMRLELPSDGSWPFGGSAEHRIEVEPGVIRCSLSFTAGAKSAPVSLGWHPWFRKPQRMSWSPKAMYSRDPEGIATGRLVAVPGGPHDDCFVIGETGVDLFIDDVSLRLRSDCTDWVVYDEPDHATCVEPQTGPPDAVNIAPRVVGPGESLGTWFVMEVMEGPNQPSVALVTTPSTSVRFARCST